MYLSRFFLNHRHWLARRDLSNPYEMHSTLSWLFNRPAEARPLWRLELTRTPLVLLQSLEPPDFSRLLTRDGFDGYFADAPESKSYLLPALLKAGERLRFRLEANPTVTRAGKRHGLTRVDEQLGWLQRKGKAAGFDILGAVVTRIERRSFKKRGTDAPIVLLAVRFDGWLEVRDPEQMQLAIRQGLGHGKSLGLGLLSISRI